MTGRADKNLAKVPTGTEVLGPGLLNTAATQRPLPDAPASPAATQPGQQARIAAASLAKAQRQRDDEESMMIMLLATRPQNGSAVVAVRATQGDTHV